MLSAIAKRAYGRPHRRKRSGAVVSDVTRIGEWSGECRSCVWVGDVHDPVVGARFEVAIAGEGSVGPGSTR